MSVASQGIVDISGIRSRILDTIECLVDRNKEEIDSGRKCLEGAESTTDGDERCEERERILAGPGGIGFRHNQIDGLCELKNWALEPFTMLHFTNCSSDEVWLLRAEGPAVPDEVTDAITQLLSKLTPTECYVVSSKSKQGAFIANLDFAGCLRPGIEITVGDKKLTLANIYTV